MEIKKGRVIRMINRMLPDQKTETGIDLLLAFLQLVVMGWVFYACIYPWLKPLSPITENMFGHFTWICGVVLDIGLGAVAIFVGLKSIRLVD